MSSVKLAQLTRVDYLKQTSLFRMLTPCNDETPEVLCTTGNTCFGNVS